MLVLLPPSEGKSTPPRGRPVDLATLTAPELTEHRERCLGALVEASARPDAAALLGTGPSLAEEVERNRALLQAPAAPARQVYTGVLYAAAGLDDLPAPARRRARDSVRTVSALWGVVAPHDRIPAYRLSMGTDLPALGRLAAYWRPALHRALDPVAAERLVVDCRSAAYAAAWPVPAGGPGHVTVRVVQEVAGRRTVVSHWAKHTRGVLTRHLLTRQGREPTNPARLLDAATELVGGPLAGAELGRGARGSAELTLVVS